MLVGPGEELARRRMAWFDENRRSFGPRSITGLVGWYDFSDINTLWQDTARSSPITADGQSIAGVTDKSGVGNHLLQNTAGNRPTYKTAIQNGKSCERTDGADVLVNAAQINYAQPNTFFLVAKHADGVTGKHFFDGSGAGRNLFGTAAGPVWTMYGGSVVSGGVTNTNANIFVVYFNGASSKAYVNGGAANISGNAGALALGGVGETITINQGQAAPLPNGSDVYELLIYNAAVSLASANALAVSLGIKWGLTWTTAV
jgi:hypothetical protein